MINATTLQQGCQYTVSTQTRKNDGAACENPAPLADSVFLTPREVMALLRLEQHAVYRHLASGEIPAVRVSRAWRIPRAELERVLEERLNVQKGKRAVRPDDPATDNSRAKGVYGECTR